MKARIEFALVLDAGRAVIVQFLIQIDALMLVITGLGGRNWR